MRSCALLLANCQIRSKAMRGRVALRNHLARNRLGGRGQNRPETNDYSRRLVVARSHLPKGRGVASQYTLPVQAAVAMPRRPQRPWKRLDTARRLQPCVPFGAPSARSLPNHRGRWWRPACGGCLGVALGEDVGEGLGVGLTLGVGVGVGVGLTLGVGVGVGVPSQLVPRRRS